MGTFLKKLATNGNFSEEISSVSELVLNKENDIPTEASFLDLYIKIIDIKFTFRLYDRCDDFPFTIV